MIESSKLEEERGQLVFIDRITKKPTTEPKRPTRPSVAPSILARNPQHQTIIGQLKQQLDIPLLIQGLLDNRFNEYDYQGRKLCMFNILVALEWTPDQQDIAALKEAFDQASQRLYDVTDAYMAINSVIVGDKRLMPCADIQILASNRLFPRSSVDGLNDAGKYQPIRLGRGLWRKDSRTVRSWNSKLGFETLVHEWLHYALGLKDQYLRLNADNTVTPTLDPVKETAMANIDVTELTGNNPDYIPEKRAYSVYDSSRDISEWQTISENPTFAFLEIDPKQHPIAAKPDQLPFPIFELIGATRLDEAKLLLDLSSTSFDAPEIDPDHCWVFVVKGSDITTPQALIAQGSYSDKAPVVDEASTSIPATTPFPLLGAAVGDTVILIGSEKNNPARPLVLRSQIGAANEAGVVVMENWQSATPTLFPLVDVTARSNSATPPFRIELSGFDTDLWDAIVFPLGQQEQGTRLKQNSSIVDGLQALDGHVMLISKSSPLQIAIASYSLGGSPSSGFPGHPNPIPAGSADGNAMIFFYDKAREALVSKQSQRPSSADMPDSSFDSFRIVTTTNLQNDLPLPEGWEPRSYTFTITTNQSFQTIQHLNPSLVLYFDAETLNNGAGDLIIGRYDNQANAWVQIKGARIEVDDFIAAAPLNGANDITASVATAPGLYRAKPVAEHYRLFRTAVERAE